MKKIFFSIFVFLVVLVGIITVPIANKTKASQEVVKLTEQDKQEIIKKAYRYSSWDKMGINVDKLRIFAEESFSKHHDEQSAAILGKIYYKGLGNIEPDYKKAEFYFNKTKDHEKNIFLGLIYYKGGYGVNKDIKKAIEYLDKTNYNCVHWILGNIYWEGKDVPQEPQEAFRNWRYAYPENYIYTDYCRDFEENKILEEYKENLKQAAEQGYPEAQYLLARQYNMELSNAKGEEVEKYKKDIVSLYEQAAEKGHKEAKFKLADIYYNSDSSNYAKAFNLFKELYNNNKNPYPCSNIALGNMYYTGKGTNKDIEKALKLWENDTCFNNDELPEEKPYIKYSVEAFNNLFEYLDSNNKAEALYREGKNCCSHMDTVDTGRYYMRQSCMQASKWYEAAAKKGHPKAQYELASLYLDKECLDEIRDDDTDNIKEEIKELLLSSANQGNVKAMEELGVQYLYGLFDEGQEPQKAEEWFLKAAKQGNGGSAYFLSRIYFEGLGADPDYQKAVYWANQAIKNGEERGYYYLGQAYYGGKGVKQDYKKALSYFKKGVSFFSRTGALCEDMLYTMYFYGQGTKRDMKEAEKYGFNNYGTGNDFLGFYDDNDYKTASLNKLWLTATENENIKSQMELFNRYKYGRSCEGVKKPKFDYSVQEIEHQYKVCKDISKDEKKAFEWLSRAAHNKDANSKIIEEYNKEKDTLEYLKDFNGKDLTPEIDYSKASEKELWYLAVINEDTKAQEILAIKNKEKDDWDSSFEWATRASNKGNVQATWFLYDLYYGFFKFKNANFFSTYYIPKQHQLLLIGIENDFAEAEVALGRMYYFGYYDTNEDEIPYPYLDLFINKDYKKAFELFQKAANQGNSEAEMFLGKMYANGQYVKKDINTAMSWFNKAIKKSYGEAFFELGREYETGKNMPKDLSKAIYYYKQAKDKGVTRAEERLEILNKK